MRRGTLFVIAWLAIGAAASGQRGYFNATSFGCTQGATIAATVLAGPLNYIDVNPKINCQLPTPSG
jgi:hypothetical protein